MYFICFQSLDNEEDVLQTAATHMAQLCAENVIMWTQYTEVVTFNENVTYLMAQEHHIARVSEMYS